MITAKEMCEHIENREASYYLQYVDNSLGKATFFKHRHDGYEETEYPSDKVLNKLSELGYKVERVKTKINYEAHVFVKYSFWGEAIFKTELYSKDSENVTISACCGYT